MTSLIISPSYQNAKVYSCASFICEQTFFKEFFSHKTYIIIMNTILRSTVRSIRSLTSLPTMVKPMQTRTIFHMVNRQSFASNTFVHVHSPSLNCKCGCAGMSKIHTKGKLSKLSLHGDLLVGLFEVIRQRFHNNLELFQARRSWLSSWLKRSLLNEKHRKAKHCQLTSMDSK